MGINRVNTDTMLKSAFNLLFLLGCGRACIIIVVIPVQQQSSTPAITTTTTTTTTTTAAAGRKKRSTDECSILETYEAMAFQYVSIPQVVLHGMRLNNVRIRLP